MKIQVLIPVFFLTAISPAVFAGHDTPCDADAAGRRCADGTVYAGASPDGNVPMYTTPSDSGTEIAWNNGNTSGYTATGVTDTITGKSNSAALLRLDADRFAPGLQPHQAARLCEDLTVNSHDDWYLPSKDELNVLYMNAKAIGGFDVSGIWYWSSSEHNAIGPWIQRFQDGGQTNGYGKSFAFKVRCVRK